MNETDQRFSAKHLHEGLMPCPRCHREISVGEPGWPFERDAVPRKRAECVACGGSWDDLDATRLLALARHVSAPVRKWLTDYISVTEAMRVRIGDQVTIETALGTFHGTRHYIPLPELVAQVAGEPRTMAARTYDIDVSQLADVIVLELQTRGTARLGRIGVFRAKSGTVGFTFDRPGVGHAVRT